MSTQYDAIGSHYEDVKTMPGARLEKYMLHEAIKPSIKGAKVLDLACGTGSYSKLLLEWGAASVMGVDISSAMIEAAEQSLTPEESKHIRFEVGDCSIPQSYGDGPFDIVFASWLLNYASCGKEMVAMFQNVYQNLSATGVFLGTCPFPTRDPKDFMRIIETQQNGRFYCSVTATGEVENGLSIHVNLLTEQGPIEFDNYYLRREVYEESAKESGFESTLQWLPLSIPKLTGIPDEYWDGYLTAPYFDVFVVEKRC